MVLMYGSTYQLHGKNFTSDLYYRTPQHVTCYFHVKNSKRVFNHIYTRIPIVILETTFCVKFLSLSTFFNLVCLFRKESDMMMSGDRAGQQSFSFLPIDPSVSIRQE